jgi:hypothetical protein
MNTAETEEEFEGEYEDEPTRLQQLMDQDSAFLIKRCRSTLEKISQTESKRTALNDEIKAKREEMEAMGIPKKALSLAGQVAKMSEDQLDGFWLALQILLVAIDRPIRTDDVQMDLFAKPESDAE